MVCAQRRPMSPRSALLILGCLIFTACPDAEKGSDTGASTGDSGDTEPTSGGDPACACIDPAEEGSFSYVCAPAPCGTVSLKCDDMEGTDALCNGFGTVVMFDEAALDCSLDQLIARTPGIVEYHSLTEGGSSSYGGAFVDVTTGLARHYGGADLGSSESAAGFVTLKDPAYFEGCKAETDVAARFDCFVRWAVEDEPTAQCDDPLESYTQI